MADASPEISSTGVDLGQPRATGVQSFLRKLRGHIEKPTNINLVTAETITVPSDDKYADHDSVSISDASEVQRYAGKANGGAFVDGAMTKHYAPIAGYEGRHRWDPSAQWTEAEEKKLVRKLDYRICSFVCFMFFALQIDRGNLNQALSDNFLDDLGMNTNNYNYGQLIFYLSFMCAELPSQLISKRLGPDNWIPIQMICWSIVAICQCKLDGVASFYTCRALLGMIEGGFIPDVVLYLTYFYTTAELPIRLAFFWTTYFGTQIIAAFLATGILEMRDIGGWEGWRWLFALEGILTVFVGIFAFFYLPPSPTQTASKFRGEKGWFTDHEEVMMVNRILRDDPSKGDMHNREGLTGSLLWEALKDYDMWPVYLIGLTWGIPQTPVASYMTLTLRSLGFATFETNLLTIPSLVLSIIHLLFWTWLSEKINNRLIIVLVTQLWTLPLLIALDTIPDDENKWVKFAITALITGFPYTHAILVAMTSRNAGSVRTRTVASAVYNMFVQGGTVIGTQLYRDEDKPNYHRANKGLLAVCGFNILFIIWMKCFYVWRNKTRAAIWDNMNEQEREEYLRTTEAVGNKRLDFRFTH